MYSLGPGNLDFSRLLYIFPVWHGSQHRSNVRLAATPAELVEVRRADGSRYTTEFVACTRCRVMAWKPELARVPQTPDFTRGWGSR
jgi:hypothetical protein